MGKASSNKKVQRAARAGGKGKASATSASWLWPSSIGVVVVLGILLIVLSRGGSADATPPTFDDHWHEAYGIYICDAYIPQFPDNVASGLGIHTHNDGLVHVEPRSALDTGDNATFGRFADGVDLEVSQERIKLPDGREFKDGDDCGSQKAEVRILRQGKKFDGDPMDMKLKDGSDMAIVFAPKGAEIPPVPFIKNLDNPLAGETGSAEVTIPPEGGDATTSTSAPAEGGDTSTTGVPLEGAETTAPPAEGTTDTSDPASSSTSAP